MTNGQSKVILALVAEFGARSTDRSDDGWSDLLLGLSHLIGADGHLVQTPSARNSVVIDNLTWGVPLSETRRERLFSMIRLPQPGFVLNVGPQKPGGPGLVLVEDRRVVVFHRRSGTSGFGAARAAIAAAVVSACSTVRRKSPCLPARLESIPIRLRQVLHGLLTGYSEKEIGNCLGISRNTVHVYVKSLYRTARVNSRYELIALCLRSGNAIESILQTEFVATFPDQYGKLPHGQIDPGQQVVSTSHPVPPVDRSDSNMPLGGNEPTGELLDSQSRPENFRPRRKIHGARVIASRRKR